jgi:ABC-2 type transport system permease protein
MKNMIAKFDLKKLIAQIKSKGSYKSIFHLIKKEFLQNFTSTIFYVVIAFSLLAHYFLMFILGGFSSFIHADLTGYFSYFPIIFPLLIPAFTMSSMVTEFKEGTDEYILAKPVQVFEFVLSKFFSSLLFVLLLLAVEFVLLLFILPFGQFDTTLILSQYLATILLAASLTAFGIFVSSVSKSQIGAFLISFLGSVILLLLGSEVISRNLPIAISTYIERLSIYTHFASILKGLITLPSLLFFAGFILLFLVLTFYKIKRDKLAGNTKKVRKLQLVALGAIGIIALITVLGQKIPGKIDATSNKLNSLSIETKKMVQSLPEKVQIEIFYSNNLPANSQTAKKELFRILRDYRNIDERKVELVYKPTDIAENATEAMTKGIQMQQFGQQGKNILEFSSITGYLGIAINFKEEYETIPFVTLSSLENIEYEVSSLIRKLTNENKKQIGILNSYTKYTSESGMTVLKELLSREYDIREIEFSEENMNLPSDLDVLIVNTPNQEMPEEVKNELKKFYSEGGSLLVMIDPVNTEMLSANINEHSLHDFFSESGITVEKTILLDVQSNVIIGYNNSRLRYPFFPILISQQQDHKITNNLSSLSFRWGSWISLNKDRTNDLDIYELFRTSEYGLFQKEGEFNIDPEQEYDVEKVQFDSYLGAVAFSKKSNADSRVVLVADGDFINDNEIVNSGQIIEPQNVAFALSSIEWLAQDEALAAIKAKQRVAAPILYPSAGYVSLIVFVFTPINILSVIAAGVVIKILRNRKSKLVYKS